MAHVNRRIGKSSETAGPTADGTGGGVLDAFIYDYFNRSGNVPVSPGLLPVSGMTATGGVISDYTEGDAVFRAHVFTGSGTFTVTSLGENSPTADVIEQMSPHQSVLEITLPLFNSQSLLDPQHIQLPLVVVDQVVVVVKVVVGEIHLLDQ